MRRNRCGSWGGERQQVRARVVAVALAACLAAPLFGSMGRAASEAGGGALHQAGVMPYGFEVQRIIPPGLIVDDELHRGFVAHEGASSNLYVYDLVNLKMVAQQPLPADFRAAQRPFAAADPKHHRIFWSQNPSSTAGFVPGQCDISAIYVLDTRDLGWRKRTLPCVNYGSQDGRSGIPDGLIVNAMSYDSASNKLYFAGLPNSVYQAYAYAATSLVLSKQPSIIAQVDADTFELDWAVDVSADCDWHEGATREGATVQRAGQHVVLHCLQGGRNQNGGGARGAALVLTLAGDRPARNAEGAPKVSVSPTYTDAQVLPIVDPVSGRLLLVSQSLPFGPAVWVYDPVAELFVGVIPTGVDATRAEGIGYALDPSTGRLYVFSSRGFVLLDARHTPLPGGVSYDTAAEAFIPGRGATRLSVDAKLHRVFVPQDDGKYWVVIDDRVPPPPPPPPLDPDRGTADIPEEPGKTGTSFSGSATAFGAHVLYTGGVPALLQAATLREDCEARAGLTGSSKCPTEAFVTPGDRELFLAQSTVDVGSGTGPSAFATGGRSAPRDFATDADVRAAGNCERDRAAELWQGAVTVVDAFCPQQTPASQQLASTPLRGVTFENMRSGTQKGNGERGFPIPGSACSGSQGRTEESSSDPSPALATSKVRCDHEALSSRAESHAGAVLVPAAPGGVGVSVGRTASSSVTYRDEANGLVSEVTSTVDGVEIGPVTIGTISTSAKTYAYGRTGTNRTEVSRTISHLRAPGYSCDQCDPHQVVEVLNRIFGARVQARLPQPYQYASPKGYTAVVAKDPKLAASDRAINSDDSVTFDGLDLIIYADYNQGRGFKIPPDPSSPNGQQAAARSRIIVGLAGVQAESHYGVFPLPAQGGPGGPGGGPGATLESLFGVGGPAYGAAGLGGGITRGAGPLGRPAGAGRFPRSIPELIEAAVGLFVNSPGQAALLALLLGLFAWPIYSAVRRRALATALTT